MFNLNPVLIGWIAFITVTMVAWVVYMCIPDDDQCLLDDDYDFLEEGPRGSDDDGNSSDVGLEARGCQTSSTWLLSTSETVPAAMIKPKQVTEAIESFECLHWD